MNERERARAQALEEMADNAGHLLQIRQYCSGWKMRDEYPGPGCMQLWKVFDFDDGSVMASIEVNHQGAIKMEVKDLS